MRKAITETYAHHNDLKQSYTWDYAQMLGMQGYRGRKHYIWAEYLNICFLVKLYNKAHLGFNHRVYDRLGESQSQCHRIQRQINNVLQ